jgi:hypothetical protein
MHETLLRNELEFHVVHESEKTARGLGTEIPSLLVLLDNPGAGFRPQYALQGRPSFVRRYVHAKGTRVMILIPRETGHTIGTIRTI